MKSVTDISICTVVCPEDCTYCNSDGFCTLCQIGFVVSSSGECVQECDVSEMSDSIQCLNCKIGCIHCQIDGLCFECQDGKYLNSMGDCIDIDCVNSDKDTAGYCVNCYSICKSCTNESSECTSCFEGKYLTSIQTCESSCQSGYFEDDLSRQCRKCQPQCL